MRILSALLFLSFTFASAQVASPKPAAQKDSTAVSVISASLAAMGTENALNNSALVNATIAYTDGSTATVVSKSMGFDRVQHEYSKNGKTSVHVVNSGAGHTDINGKTRKLPLWDASRGQEYIPAFTRMADYQNPTLNVAYIGLETLNGKKVHHIKLSETPSDPAFADIDEAMSTLHIFIDAENLTVTKIQNFDFSPETPTNRSVAETNFDDYRSVSGVLVPYHSIRFVAGQKYCETTLQSVTLNAAVTAADFQ